MEKKFRIALFLMIIPVVINACGSAYCLLERPGTDFAGYLFGTILSFIFSIAWVIIAKKVSQSNIMALFTISLGAFPIKIIVFALFAFGGYYLFRINQIFFGVSFLFGTAASLVIEVWYIISMNKLIVEKRAKDKLMHNSGKP